MAYRELEDGTRVYSNGFKYKPVPLDKRRNRKYPDGTQWHGGKPYAPLPLLPEDERVKPYTRPDEEAVQHHVGCACRSCQVPRVRRLKRVRLGIRARVDRPWG
jgi:hypothetical protein